MKQVIVSSVVVLTSVVSIGEQTIAQVVPDNTLGSTVTLNGTTFEINNGSRSGNNLFHSFSQFSVPTNGSAIFNNATDVQNIFSRVTGTQLSNIDGILKTQGSANLFLMNPNGIIFGPNAQLQLGGSFLGTTASAIKFADGVQFNTVNTPPALLSVNLPIGLQMGRNPGPIQLQGTGHQLQFINRFAPIGGAGQQSTGLRVNPNQTLALIGGDIQLSGGVASAPSGRVELGSITAGTVGLNSIAKGWTFNYDRATAFGDIRLGDRSSIDASGIGPANLSMIGRRIDLSGGSIAILLNKSPTQSSNIQVRASESFEITGSPDLSLVSLLVGDAVAGFSPDLNIVAPQLSLRDTGIIASRTFGAAAGGTISITATDILADGKNDRTTTNRTGVSWVNAGKGDAGTLKISTQTLRILNGAFVGSTTSGNGNGSQVTVKAATIAVDGLGLQPSILSAGTLGKGNAGELNINTAQLTITNGGGVSTSTLASGRAGNLSIEATDFIKVDGQAYSNGRPVISGLGSDASALPPTVRQSLGITEPLTGASGNVTVTTPNLSITNGGQIRVNNAGSGNGGEIKLTTTHWLDLKGGGQITAATASGTGGNIIVNTPTLLLRNQSQIVAQAGGNGNGGNITINAPLIVGIANSDIIANAVKGRGGSINIRTQGLFGLKYRDRLTSDNDITASSEFGISGNVQVSTIGINPTNALNSLPMDVVDSTTQISDRCSAARTSSFIATGRGGMPQSPMKKKGSDRLWNDLRPTSPSVTPIAIADPIEPIVEASAIQVDELGAIALVASKPLAQPLETRIGLQAVPSCGIKPV